jgi:predicted acyl esterase
MLEGCHRCKKLKAKVKNGVLFYRPQKTTQTWALNSGAKIRIVIESTKFF